jgi:DNA-3-methyladenine glycosylase II
MFFPSPATTPDWFAARRVLRRDGVMRRIVASVGPCTLAPRRDYFVALCQSIYAQQISTAIATTLYRRFAARFPHRRPTPVRVAAALEPGGWDEPTIRHVGLSRQKRAYILDLARQFTNGDLRPARLRHLPDEQVIEQLTRVRGIGVWTAEMFLIFVLNRPDVLPVDDLGIRDAARRFYRLHERPGPDVLRRLAEPWRPWRTVGTWYLWRALGTPEKDRS